MSSIYIHQPQPQTAEPSPKSKGVLLGVGGLLAVVGFVLGLTSSCYPDIYLVRMKPSTEDYLKLSQQLYRQPNSTAVAEAIIVAVITEKLKEVALSGMMNRGRMGMGVTNPLTQPQVQPTEPPASSSDSLPPTEPPASSSDSLPPAEPPASLSDSLPPTEPPASSSDSSPQTHDIFNGLRDLIAPFLQEIKDMEKTEHGRKCALAGCVISFVTIVAIILLAGTGYKSACHVVFIVALIGVVIHFSGLMYVVSINKHDWEYTWVMWVSLVSVIINLVAAFVSHQAVCACTSINAVATTRDWVQVEVVRP